MSRTRWKLMTCALGLGLGGLAAVADTPQTPGISCAPTPHKVAKPPAPSVPGPALPMPPPKAEAKPELPPMPPAMELPSLPAPPVVPLPSLPSLPEPVAKTELKLPALPPPAMPMLDSPATPPVLLATPSRMQPTSDLFFTTQRKPDAPAMPAVSAEPKPSAFGDRLPPPAQPAPAINEVNAVAVAPSPVATEKKLKVQLFMGDERPKFEVRDGEVVYLRVTSEKVDVKSPTGAVEANLSTMRAAGKVRFVTPGGEGTCDELAVVPGSGQVTVTGRVAFTYSWGKVETTVTGEKMTFRLGDAPGVAR